MENLTSIILPYNPEEINVTRNWEVRMWSDKFNCNDKELKKAVRIVGSNPAKVQKHIASLK